MNSCVLMARIVQPPQIRYTPDNLAIAEMVVEFESSRPDDPPSTLKVIGWGNLATETTESVLSQPRSDFRRNPNPTG
jgi:single-strand DNA-binding protein